MNVTAQQIVTKALELGYEDCGIINVDEMAGYADKLTERIERLPDNREKYSSLYRFAALKTSHPQAKSIVICVRRYGKYHIPTSLQGMIAKYYLTDGRVNADSVDYQASIAFENYLAALNLEPVTERNFGITALRWAAYRANLGIIRRNNFLYTNNGSWNYLEAWLINEEMDYKPDNSFRPCPHNCNKCIEACPTKSLCAAYTMSRNSCISCLTTWSDDPLDTPYGEQIGSWLYGCDVCQDVCPYNKNKWIGETQFPHLQEFAQSITPEQILTMDYEHLRLVVQQKFWYITAERIWKWKVNALNIIANNYQDKYYKLIKQACEDEYAQVRSMAHQLLAKLDAK